MDNDKIISILCKVFAVDIWIGGAIPLYGGIYCIVYNYWTWVLLFPIAILFGILGYIAWQLWNINEAE
ncbi:MAG: hypothetical protein PHI12_07465 [Dehalococcoidales bacterium]|nr:hypothetical protein [Dehalococcoidales bacterium]